MVTIKDFLGFSRIKIVLFVVLSLIAGVGMLFFTYCPSVCFGSCPPPADWCPGKGVVGVFSPISFVLLLPVIAVLMAIGGPVSAVVGYTPSWLNAVLVAFGILLGAVLMYLYSCIVDLIVRKLKH